MKTSNKHIIRVLFCLFLVLVTDQSTIYAHKEPTHQYIVREAYKLLKLHIGRPIQEYETYIMGVNGLGNEGEFDNTNNPWSYITVPGGVWSEDQNDVVQRKEEKEVLFHQGFFTSINHFWNPDIDAPGHNEKFALALKWNPYPAGNIWNWCSYARTYGWNEVNDIMAYKKAMIYHGFSYPEFSETIGFKFSKNGKKYVSPSAARKNLIDWYLGNIGYPNVSGTDKKELIYNIIGRICHLLGDMSVPAHVQSYNGLMNEHGLWHDPFEDFMNYKQWSGNKYSRCDSDDELPAQTSRVEYWYAKKIFEDKGSFVNPYCYPNNTNPIYYLFYTTAQIADHFATNRMNGDNYFPPSIGNIGEIQSVINEDLNSPHPGPKTTVWIDGNVFDSGYFSSYSDIDAIRDATFPYVIRATAGLLYFYAVEFGLINENDRCTEELNYWEKVNLKGANYCFQAEKSIMAGALVQLHAPNHGPFVIESGAKNVVFHAGNKIIFRPGFHAKAGSNVHAYIQGCVDCTNKEMNPYIIPLAQNDDRQKHQNLAQNDCGSLTLVLGHTFERRSIPMSHSSDNQRQYCAESCCGKSGISRIILTNQMGHNIVDITDDDNDLSEYMINDVFAVGSTGHYFVTLEHANGFIERKNLYSLER